MSYVIILIGDETLIVLYFTLKINFLAGHQPFCLCMLYSNYISTCKACKISRMWTQTHVKSAF